LGNVSITYNLEAQRVCICRPWKSCRSVWKCV